MGNGGIQMHESAGILPLFAACTRRSRGGVSWAEWWPSSSVELVVSDPPREISIKPIHLVQQPK